MQKRIVLYYIGKLMQIEGLLMLLPMAVSVYYGEGTWLWFLIPVLLTMGIGTLISWKKPQGSMYAREGFVIVGSAWIILSAFGALPFVLSREIPSFVDAMFETVSGFTTSGGSILVNVEALSNGMLFWRSFTLWIGGMGVLVFLLAVLPSAETSSMYMLRAEVPGPIKGKLVSKSKISARILYTIYIALTIVEIIFLVAGGMPFFDSVLHTFGTAGTGGFGIKCASVGYYDSAYIDWVIGIFMVLFGINFNLFYMVIIGRGMELIRNKELHTYLIIIAVATVLIGCSIYPIYGSVGQAARYSFFQVASIITTTGYGTADFNQWPSFAQGILVVLMFIGACAGSTGGGLKISRVTILLKTGFREIRRTLFPRSVTCVKLEGKPVDMSVVHGVSSFFIVYVLLLVISVFCVSIDGKDLLTTGTSVVACLNNIGPGLGECGPAGSYAGFSDWSKIVLIFDMLAGRLEIFPILTLFMPSTWKK